MPVPSEDPPVLLAYQLIVPALAVAPNATVPLPHTEPGVVPVIVGTTAFWILTAIIARYPPPVWLTEILLINLPQFPELMVIVPLYKPGEG